MIFNVDEYMKIEGEWHALLRKMDPDYPRGWNLHLTDSWRKGTLADTLGISLVDAMSVCDRWKFDNDRARESIGAHPNPDQWIMLEKLFNLRARNAQRLFDVFNHISAHRGQELPKKPVEYMEASAYKELQRLVINWEHASLSDRTYALRASAAWYELKVWLSRLEQMNLVQGPK